MNNWNTLLIEMIEESLQSNGWARFRVISNSMQPLIRKDDWVHAAGITKTEKLHFGDVVLYRRNGNNTMHRIVGYKGGRVITKGDGCLTLDEPVVRKDVFARVIQLERGNGTIKLHSFPGKVLGFIMAAGSLMVGSCYLCYRKLIHNKMEIV